MACTVELLRKPLVACTGRVGAGRMKLARDEGPKVCGWQV